MPLHMKLDLHCKCSKQQKCDKAPKKEKQKNGYTNNYCDDDDAKKKNTKLIPRRNKV